MTDRITGVGLDGLAIIRLGLNEVKVEHRQMGKAFAFKCVLFKSVFAMLTDFRNVNFSED